MTTRFIPSWEELQQFGKVHRLDKFTGDGTQYVNISLLHRIFRVANANGEYVTMPTNWGPRIVSKIEYEKWYNNYTWDKESHTTRYITERRFFSNQSNLSRYTRDILQGEEEDD